MRRPASRLVPLLPLLLAGCGLTTATDLGVGDCFDLPDQASTTEATEVGVLRTTDCADPHDAEVFVEFPFEDGAPFPGEAAIFDAAVARCDEEFQALFGHPTIATRFNIYALYPTAETWADGDRRVTCAAYDFERAPVTGRLADVVVPLDG